MAVPVPKTSFGAGEVAPKLYGHFDLVRLRSAAATMRNLFVDYAGGSRSRAGTAFVGYSKQTGRAYPPRAIPFQSSVTQGLALEFGNFYMRVISNGAYVTDASLPITGATQSNPLTVTIPASGSATATPINTNVYVSYRAGDIIKLAGGTFSVRAQLQATATLVLAANPTLGAGTGYAPADTITVAGGVASTKAIFTINTTRVNSATVNTAGTGGTPGSATVTGTTGTGTKFSAVVFINASGGIQNVTRISTPGSYTVNPTTPSAEPVTGGGLVGAKLALALGPNTTTISNAGVYTVNPTGGVFTQFSTTGSGTGAQFTGALMGIQAASVFNPGSYTVTPANPVQQFGNPASGGSGAAFTMTWGSTAQFSAGDWIYFSGVGGMTQLNGRTLVVRASLGGGVFSFQDVFGNLIDSTSWTAWTSGGTAQRIYTVATPYSEVDLKWLKFTESVDVMSIACLNQDTGVEYPPYDVSRLADNNWTFTQVTMQPTVQPPGGCSLSATFNWSIYAALQPNSTTVPTVATYQYCVTAVNKNDGSESVASPIGQLTDAVDIGVTAGTVTVTWPAETDPNVVQYNIYKATPNSAAGFTAPAPMVGALFGYVGSSLGTEFADNNIVPDFAQTPPVHANPFARGQIVGLAVTGSGNNYTTATVTVTTSTGSGLVAEGIIDGGGPGGIVGFLVVDPGHDYASTDTVTVNGDGSGAFATPIFGAFTGTYPGLVFYLQQRRGYANTLNNPDTYWLSEPGGYTNFDVRIPTIDSDAIQGSPWGQQINGIQWFVIMPGGALALTGGGVWFVGGQGSSSFSPQPITPSQQEALPEEFIGASPTVPPMRIGYDLIFLAYLNNRYRDAQIQYFTNIVTSVDISLFSDHLFTGAKIIEHAWCEEPYKLIWAVRDDGIALSLTYYKPQEVLGWARHDTLGAFVSVCSVIEPPVNAAYFAVKRTTPAGAAYMFERMDNRQWVTGVESTWCVDCALSMPQPKPAATLGLSSATGLGSLTGVTGLVGGTGYNQFSTAFVVDANGKGPGSGAVAFLTIASGIITGVTFSPAGQNYTSPSLGILDPSGRGSGFQATITLNNTATFTASAPVFVNGDVGSVIRAGGGIAVITAYIDSQNVTVDIKQPFLATSYAQGSWTKTAPTTIVTGLFHLIGMTVTGLADGNPIPPTVVAADGTLTLSAPASAITVGLGFTPQLQDIYLETGQMSGQGQRKHVADVVVRVENSRGLQIGTNQVDGSTLNPVQIAPSWFNMEPLADQGTPAYNWGVMPLWTGDALVSVSNDLGRPGQVAIQQVNPLPMNVLSIMPDVLPGDTPSASVPEERGGGGGGGGGRGGRGG